ncbi:hypothetical protein DFH06DRAFT_1152561 [Mycena polygramma]|nr:hypothetical protein DFH06DRAFT_1152561 [Mycena polygramma]
MFKLHARRAHRERSDRNRRYQSPNRPMSVMNDTPSPDTQVPPTPDEIPPTPGVPGWFPDEPQSQAKEEEGAGGPDEGQEGAGGGLVETAKSYSPGEEDVQRALTNAGQAAKGWLPTSVAAYFPSSEESSTATSDPSVTSETSTTSALTCDLVQGRKRPKKVKKGRKATSTTVHTGGSDSPHPAAPLALGVNESRFIEALPSPPISIPISESPAPGSFVATDSSSLPTGAIEKTDSMAQTGSAALNSSRPEDNFPSDTPASFIANSSPLPTTGPPPPPKDSHTSDSIHLSQGAAPPVPTKDAPSPPASSASESESGSEDEDDKEDGASGGKKKRNKRKLLQRLKEKLHVGHGHSHDEEAAYHQNPTLLNSSYVAMLKTGRFPRPAWYRSSVGIKSAPSALTLEESWNRLRYNVLNILPPTLLPIFFNICGF